MEDGRRKNSVNTKKICFRTCLSPHGRTVHPLAHETVSAYGVLAMPPKLPHHLTDQT